MSLEEFYGDVVAHTVADLIGLLQRFPSNMEVAMFDAPGRGVHASMERGGVSTWVELHVGDSSAWKKG